MTTTPEIRNFLTCCVAMFRQNLKPGQAAPEYLGPMDLVLREGTEYRPAEYDPAEWRGFKGTPRNCLQDAWDLSSHHPELTYVEGYAARTIVAHHAWCVTADGRVVDPTWAASGEVGDEYLGIPFGFRFVAATIMEKESYGVLDMNRVLYEKPFDLKEVMR